VTGPVAERRRATHDFKRGRILAAARSLLERSPPADLSVRAIAEAAGYTPGALYAYYPSRQDIYAALAAEFLAEVGRAVRQAVATGGPPDAAVRAGARALYGQLGSRRAELGLLLRLVEGAGAPLSPAADRHLNGRLIAALRPIADRLTEGGLAAVEAGRTTMILFAEIAGLLLLDRSRRLAVLGFAADDLLERQLDLLLEPGRNRRNQQGDRA